MIIAFTVFMTMVLLGAVGAVVVPRLKKVHRKFYIARGIKKLQKFVNR